MTVAEFREWLLTRDQGAIIKVYDDCDQRFIPFDPNGLQHNEYRRAGIMYLDLGG